VLVSLSFFTSSNLPTSSLASTSTTSNFQFIALTMPSIYTTAAAALALASTAAAQAAGPDLNTTCPSPEK